MIGGINNNYQRSGALPLNANSNIISKNSFGDILKDKESKIMTAKDYLATLSSQDLKVIQKEHCLAQEINVNSLSEEGAENLLVANGDYRKLVDLNNDGITEIGAGKNFIFPPPNAPDEVKDAWDQATANLTLKEKMSALLPFLAKQIEVNAYRMPDGTFKVRSPGEAGYRNAFGSTVQSYYNLIDEVKAELENDPERANSERQKYIKFEMSILNKFLENLNKLTD